MWPLEGSPRLHKAFLAWNFPLYPEKFRQGKPVWGQSSSFYVADAFFFSCKVSQKQFAIFSDILDPLTRNSIVLVTLARSSLTPSQPTPKRTVFPSLTRAGERMLIGKLMTRVSSGPVAL